MTSTSLKWKEWLYVPGRIVQHIARRGFADTCSHAGFRFYEAYRDRRLGINTRDFIPWYDLGEDPESMDYEPVGYLTLDRALSYAPADPTSVFLDYGSGQGRVIATAAERPFKRVIGVELSALLCDQAKENIARARKKFCCPDIRIVNSAAQAYVVPDDVNVVFMYNPFTGSALAKTLEQLRQSLLRVKRELIILYVMPRAAANQLDSLPWLEHKVDWESQRFQLIVFQPSRNMLRADTL